MSHEIILLRRMASKRMTERPEEFKAKSKTSFVRKAKAVGLSLHVEPF